MSDFLPFPQFVKAHEGKGRDVFLREVAEPHLLFKSLPEDADAVGFGSATRNISMWERLRAKYQGEWLLPVRKRPGANRFDMMVTLGRAPNNDLVLADHRVSKFHCYFHKDQAKWLLTDVGSTNGSTVNGETLTRDTPRALGSGTIIQLGGAIDIFFYEPADLHERIVGGLDTWR